MAARDYYEVLGVRRDATQEEIKRAYRRLARQYHPDVNKDDPQAAERFKEVAEAYQVLSDPEKRARYDQFGHAGVDGGAAGFEGAGGFGDFGGFPGFGDIEDLFDAFFGGGRRGRRAPAQGRHLQTEIELSFEEAAFGVQKELEVARKAVCGDCGGSGAARGTQVRACPRCGGRGQVQSSRATPLGQFVTVQTCPACGGRGRLVEKPCPVCGGSGVARQRQRITLRVPAGIADGEQLRLAGQGEPGVHGGPPGDLFVTVRVRPHPAFRREGDDVVSDVVVEVPQAVLGATVEVDTLDGRVPLEVPPGTQSGSVFRLRGKGIPRLRGGGRGDHRVRVQVHIPKDLSEEERALYRRLAELRGTAVTDDRGFFQRMRDAFNR
ncbi:MAG: molecular chaperone DnaJ [Clostridia bacterium]|nr:molecular chaperone DnaJ [Clostridia bacterium]